MRFKIVLWVLGFMLERASKNNPRFKQKLMGQELTAAEATAAELEESLAELQLEGLPERVARLHEACELIRANLLTLRVLDERAGSTSEARRLDTLLAQLAGTGRRKGLGGRRGRREYRHHLRHLP